MAKILIVEDQVLIVELIEMVLQHRGHQTHHTGDGGRAVELARSIRPDLILLDLLLPNMDGYVIQSKLLEHDETRAIPLIVVTSKSHTQEIFRMSTNVAAFIAKPFGVNELIQKVDDCLKKSRA
ncbi:MAG: hypothetical protein A2902_06875 [Elusimicrobia bacterium RIFCSPLOWO2_01_FULL_64_13]|nr:MAG: hypothetical protein A2636_04100 [Elusimicrobia bacterium RIFCSPHIGHO2_01_FULL_64_10]OGR97457.1 MAG: hypothetical protein A2902_06875 [Elusimicrobia bacterium RIFCSPLOWO2_01_FULL_64_13]